MAVAYSDSKINTGSSTAPTWLIPATVTAGHTWLVAAYFRGGGASVTISGVPASFTLVTRNDYPSSSTLVLYRYTATGSETPNGTLGTITISATSRWYTTTLAFSGVDPTTPLGTLVSGQSSTGTTTTSSAAAAIATGDAVYAVTGYHSNTVPALSAPLTTVQAAGSGAGTSQVNMAAGYALGALASQTYTSTDGANIAIILAVPVLAAAGGAPAAVPSLVMAWPTGT